MLRMEVTQGRGTDQGRVLTCSGRRSRTIGRASTRLHVEDTKVSRRQARIWVEDGRFHIQDLDSRHGTFLNGQRLSAPATLSVGDQLWMGNMVIVVHEADPPADEASTLPTLPAAPAAPGPAPAELAPAGALPEVDLPEGPALALVVEGRRDGQPTDLAGQVLLAREQAFIGRADTALTLPDSRVSGRHARVYAEGDQWLIADAGSSTGTFVNGWRIDRPTPLNVGDHLWLGRLRLAVAALSLPEAPEAGPVTAIEADLPEDRVPGLLDLPADEPELSLADALDTDDESDNRDDTLADADALTFEDAEASADVSQDTDPSGASVSDVLEAAPDDEIPAGGAEVLEAVSNEAVEDVVAAENVASDDAVEEPVAEHLSVAEAGDASDSQPDVPSEVEDEVAQDAESQDAAEPTVVAESQDASTAVTPVEAIDDPVETTLAMDTESDADAAVGADRDLESEPVDEASDTEAAVGEAEPTVVVEAADEPSVEPEPVTEVEATSEPMAAEVGPVIEDTAPEAEVEPLAAEVASAEDEAPAEVFEPVVEADADASSEPATLADIEVLESSDDVDDETEDDAVDGSEDADPVVDAEYLVVDADDAEVTAQHDAADDESEPASEPESEPAAETTAEQAAPVTEPAAPPITAFVHAHASPASDASDSPETPETPEPPGPAADAEKAPLRPAASADAAATEPERRPNTAPTPTGPPTPRPEKPHPLGAAKAQVDPEKDLVVQNMAMIFPPFKPVRLEAPDPEHAAGEPRRVDPLPPTTLPVARPVGKSAKKPRRRLKQLLPGIVSRMLP